MAGWNSLSDQSTPGWEEAGNPSATAIDELVRVGAYDLSGSGLNLGTILTAPAAFGEPLDLTFEYAVEGEDATLEGIVDFAGPFSANNLLLTVDPTTGEASLQNSSSFSVSLLGYSILSDSGSLDVAGWESLDSQGQGVFDEAAPTALALSELAPGSALTLIPGQAFALGSPFSTTGERDLQLEFQLEGEADARLATVQYGEVVVAEGLPGDYNGDGVVDAADYTVYRNNEGVGEPVERGPGRQPRRRRRSRPRVLEVAVRKHLRHLLLDCGSRTDRPRVGRDRRDPGWWPPPQGSGGLAPLRTQPARPRTVRLITNSQSAFA